MSLSYFKSKGKIDQILAKMSEKVTKQIEESLKEAEKFRRINQNFADMFDHFEGLTKVI